MLQKFFAAYPKFHIAKFLIDQGLHRQVMLILYKMLYRSWFRLVNRIQIINTLAIHDLINQYPSHPFLIVENHCAAPDVMMHLGIWGKLGKNTFTFVSEGSYSPKHTFSTPIIHFSEMVPRFGSGQDSINRMVARLMKGDIVNIFPAGTYPGRKFANSGFVQEGYSGAARVAYEYEQRTGHSLDIVPVCSLGANLAYPPRRHHKKYYQKINSKILVKFGSPFTVEFSSNPDYQEISDTAQKIQQKIADIWHQKRLIPNWQREYIHKLKQTGRPRFHSLKKPPHSKKFYTPN